ncbi:hypothetical protein [Rhodopirellula sallentina]|nr:hypothetical protein [Rhodopirellula sallentina]
MSVRDCLHTALLSMIPLVSWSTNVVNAEVVICATENGSGGVYFQGTGSLDLTDLEYVGTNSPFGLVHPDSGLLGFGGEVDLYTGLTSPGSFGANCGLLGMTQTQGNPFQLLNDVSFVGVNDTQVGLGVPKDYVSGEPITFSGTVNASFETMGLSLAESYYWRWGEGEHADYVVLKIGTCAVSEPTSLLAMVPIATVLLRRRRQRP